MWEQGGEIRSFSVSSQVGHFKLPPAEIRFQPNTFSDFVRFLLRSLFLFPFYFRPLLSLPASSLDAHGALERYLFSASSLRLSLVFAASNSVCFFGSPTLTCFCSTSLLRSERHQCIDVLHSSSSAILLAILLLSSLQLPTSRRAADSIHTECISGRVRVNGGMNEVLSLSTLVFAAKNV